MAQHIPPSAATEHTCHHPRSSCLRHHPNAPFTASPQQIAHLRQRKTAASRSAGISLLVSSRVCGTTQACLEKQLQGSKMLGSGLHTPGHFSRPPLLHGPSPAKQPLTKEIDPPALRENRHDASAPLSRHQIQTPPPCLRWGIFVCLAQEAAPSFCWM